MFCVEVSDRYPAKLYLTYKLVLSRGDIKSVQGDSGHAQAEMVTEIYSHVLDENRRKNMLLFEQEFYQNYGTV